MFQDYVKHPVQPVFVVSYEMFVRNYELISRVAFDLIVCDEGHRLKNTNIKTTTVSITPTSKPPLWVSHQHQWFKKRFKTETVSLIHTTNCRKQMDSMHSVIQFIPSSTGHQSTVGTILSTEAQCEWDGKRHYVCRSSFDLWYHFSWWTVCRPRDGSCSQGRRCRTTCRNSTPSSTSSTPVS